MTIRDEVLLPRPARQIETVLGNEVPDGPAGKYCTWVDQHPGRKSWVARFITTPTSIKLDPPDGRGQPGVDLSAFGSVAQVGVDHNGEFGAYIDSQGYIVTARPGAQPVRLPDNVNQTQERLKRKALFMLRDPEDTEQVGVFAVPATRFDLYMIKNNAAPVKVHSQPREQVQPLTMWTPRPMSGRAKGPGAQKRRLFIFGEKDARGKMQGMELDVDTRQTRFITNDPDALMAGCSYWRDGQRWFVCVGVERGLVPVAVRTYCEEREGEMYERREDYAPPAAQLSAYSDPGASQSPEVGRPLATGEQIGAWTIHERQGAISTFACGMKGCVAVAIMGRPETTKVLTVLDHPVCEPEVHRAKDGKSAWVFYERGRSVTNNWNDWNPELRVIGPITVGDLV